MEQKRYVETGGSSIFGEYLYNQIVPQGHFFTEVDANHRLGAFHTKADQILQKKDANKQLWLELKETPQYQQGLKERYKIERKFGEVSKDMV